jgi:hypothetical protein
MNRALNGNHEMYSGGYGYFRQILSAFEQSSSYFALANDHWLLVGLDTASVDQTIDDEQYAWFQQVVNDAGDRHVIVFSHHPVFEQPFGGPVRRLVEKVRPLLESRRIDAWAWAWEHYCVIYDAHPVWGLRGRTVGNGGIPARRRSELTDAPVEQVVGSVIWRRMTPSFMVPSAIVLDGPNPYVVGKEMDFVPQGFITYTFDGPILSEAVRLADGTVVHTTIIGGGGAA